MKSLQPKTFLKLAASVALAGGGLYAYVGGMSPLQYQESSLDSQIFLYRDLGSDRGSGKSKILRDLQSDLNSLGTQDYTLTSVFYNDAKPDDFIRNSVKGHGRLVVGAMMNPSHKELAKEFMNQHREYHAVETQSMHVLSAAFPYRGALSYWMLNLNNAYSKMMGYGIQKNLVDQSTGYFVERYPFVNGGKPSVEIMIPYGPNSKQLETSTLPTPWRSGPVEHLLNK